MTRVILLAALMAFTTAVQAAPSVFVRDESGAAWWTRQMEARILGKAAGTVAVKQLSSYLDETMICSPYDVCALEAVQTDTFVGLVHFPQKCVRFCGRKWTILLIWLIFQASR
jgi:hypothetical protein